MSRIFSKRLAGVVASVVAFAIIAPSTFLSVKADDANKVQLGSFEYATADNLGGANAFAVFAKNYTDTSSDMEGLIAADNVTFGGQDFGASGNVSQYIVEGYNLNYFGSSISGTINQIRKADALIVPDNVTITTGDQSINNGNGVKLSFNGGSATFNNITDILNSSDASKITTVSNSTFTINFDQAFNDLKSYSTSAYNHENTVVEITSDENNINIVCGQGLNYVNLEAGEIASKQINIVGADTNDYSLIINVKNDNSNFTFNHTLTIDNTGYEPYSSLGGKILWNLGPDYTGEVTFVQDAMGVVLAPSGSVLINQSHNGSVFAANINNNGCEIHQNPFSGSYTKPNTFTTTPAPTDTPEPTAVVTDTPEPTAVVTDTPEPTAVVTDTPEPTAVVTDTPEPTAVVTDTPEPTAVVTDTPEPTAVVTDTPVPTTVVTDTPVPTTVVTDTPVPTTVVTDTPEPTAVVTDTPVPTTVVTDTPVPTTVVTDTPVPTTVVTDTPVPTTVVTDTPVPTTVVTDTPVPTTVVTDTPVPTTVVTDTPVPTTVVTDTPVPTTVVTDTPVPTTVVTSTPVPTTVVTSTPVPTTVVTSTPAPVSTITLTISKQDMTGVNSSELAGAQMILTANTNSSLRYLKVSGGKTGAAVTQTAKTISWTSGDTPFVIEELPDGTYTLEETVAPDGYDVITTTQFTVSGGTVTKSTNNTDVSFTVSGNDCYVTAFDEAKNTASDTQTTVAGVEISKQDIAGNEIADATLTITSLDGKDLSNVYVTQNGVNVNLVLSSDLKSVSFKTTDTSNSIVYGLEAGKYELKETVTPAQYLRAEAIVFEISNNGNVINTATNVQGSPIVMIDEADPTYSTSGTTTSIAFSKQSMTNLGTELVGATMKITTSNLSVDLSGVKYSGGDTVICTTSMITWNTSDKVFEVALPDGTYTLEEVVAPDGYSIITTTTFTVSGGVVTKTSSNTDVDITGTYVTAFDEAYTGPSTLVAGASRIPPTTVESINEAVEKASTTGMAYRAVPATGEGIAMTDVAAIILLAAAAVTISVVTVKTKKETR